MNLVKLCSLVLLVLALAAPLPLLSAAGMKPEDLVAQHLASIGTSEARAAAKNRLVQGNCALTVLVGGQGIMEGPGVFTSEGRKLKYIMRFDRPDYFGEEFIYDGQKSFTGMYRPGSRSRLAGFVLSQDVLLRESLLGGTLSAAWALLDVPGRTPKLSYDGLKKVEGRQLHQLTYRARKGGGDLTARLYFEPETFRHVYSVFSIEVGAGIGTTTAGLGTLGPITSSAEESSARQQVTRIKLEEYFSDFTTVNGLTLPSTWKLKFTTEGERSMILEYLVRVSKIEDNVTLPQDAFLPSGLTPSN